MPVVAFDDILFERHGLTGTFKAPLGVAVAIKDEKKFIKKYDTTLDSLFIKHEAVRKKRIYKAAHLVNQILDLSVPFIDDFLKSMSKLIGQIDVFYSYFPSNLVPKIYVYKDTHPRWYDSERFINLIQNSYAHICVWRYLQLHPDCRKYNLHCDYFEGKVTPAWENIRDMDNLQLYNSGSECNCFISTADLILRHIQNRLQGTLLRQNVQHCFDAVINGTHVDAHWLGPKKEFLNSIAPHKDISANVRPRVKHPIFIFAWQNPTNRASEKDAFEWSSLYSKTMERAFESDGCVRFWDPNSGPHFVEEDKDVVIVANEQARSIVESIRSVFPNIKVEETLKQ
jgi:hypothetical protein